MTDFVIRSIEDVQRLWLKVREVPSRTEGRKHHHEEEYCLGVYLSALGRNGFLNYPFTLKRGESSNHFVLKAKSGEVVGLQVTSASEPWLQGEMSSAIRKYLRAEFTTRTFGWVGDEAEKQWCGLIRGAIELAKLRRFAPAARHDLLVYDDTPLAAVDRRKVIAALDPWVRELKSDTPTLGRISIIVSLDVLFDVGGLSRILPYVHWSAPDLDETPMQSFSERVELAGRVEVERAIREPSEDRIPAAKNSAPAYYVSSNGRIVKRTAEGRRFEVRIKENGGEIIVRELHSA
ncbi:MAG: hypothetical protein WCD12_08455 [Candidatus Binatus sp.]|uniref:hypothetical protein n=2 Tax=Candidatus Binatus sp. TaxID=2811406 RepID=UPI003C7870ED